MPRTDSYYVAFAMMLGFCALAGLVWIGRVLYWPVDQLRRGPRVRALVVENEALASAVRSQGRKIAELSSAAVKVTDRMTVRNGFSEQQWKDQ